MVQTMIARLFTRRIVAFVLALGLFLNGAVPSWATPSTDGKSSMPAGMSMAMSGMAMQNDHMISPGRDASNKPGPCKSTDGSCAVCMACAIPVALVQDSLPIRLLDRGEKAIFARDVNRNGIAVLPALPPPILLA
jgi:hypothetical protein